MIDTQGMTDQYLTYNLKVRIQPEHGERCIDEYCSFCLVTLFLTGLSQIFSNNRKYLEF